MMIEMKTVNKKTATHRKVIRRLFQMIPYMKFSVSRYVRSARFPLLGILFILSAGCDQLDKSIASNILRVGVTSPKGILSDVALKLPPSDYICVLGPYTRRIVTKTEVSNEVNAYLSALDFQGDEGHWILVYGVPGNWKHEQISLRKVELFHVATTDGSQADSVCGQANAVRLIQYAPGVVSFIAKDKK